MDAGSIVRVVRKRFYGSHSEYEFFVVMDVYKEKEEIVKELQRAQVSYSLIWFSNSREPRFCRLVPVKILFPCIACYKETKYIIYSVSVILIDDLVDILSQLVFRPEVQNFIVSFECRIPN